MGAIEDIILRYSQRGMNVLRPYLHENYCMEAAGQILTWGKGTVILTTGFYVAGYAETDGPAGTAALALTLKGLGYHPVIVTDGYCRGFFECRDLEVVYVPIGAQDQDYRALLEEYHPVGLIAIERCGINIQNDYANMRGISIAEHTARIDRMFELSAGRIPSIGVGDGGNEIGMGNVSEVIRGELSLVPCRVPCDQLVIASESNWGAYGLAAGVLQVTGHPERFPDGAAVEQYISETVAIGSVDGVTHERKVGVDGYEIGVEREIVDALREEVNRAAAAR